MSDGPTLVIRLAYDSILGDNSQSAAEAIVEAVNRAQVHTNSLRTPIRLISAKWSWPVERKK